MDFLNQYNECKKIHYKNYYINDKKNILILKKLSEIIIGLNKLNIYITLTGSIALFLKFNTIYRSFKDIDLILPSCKFTKLQYLKFFDQKVSVSGPVSFSCIREYINHFLLDNNEHIMSLYSIPDGQQIDLIPKIPVNNLYVSTATHKNIEYKYILPSKYIDVKYSYGRDQDKDDINFYNKYLKNN